MNENSSANARFRKRTDHNLVFTNTYDALQQKLAAWAPLAEELRTLGFDVNDPRDLYRFAPYPGAIPLLIDFLRRDEADQVRVEVAGALDVKEASPWWDDIKALYLGPNGTLTKSGLGFVLSTLLTRERLDEYIELAMDTGNGSSRATLLRALKRVRDPRGLATLEALRGDPAVAVELDAIFRGKSRKD